MLGHPDPDTIEAVNRLENDGDFKKIVSWLRRERGDLGQKLVDSSNDPGVLRGSCRVLDNFLSVVDGAFIPRPIADGRKF